MRATVGARPTAPDTHLTGASFRTGDRHSTRRAESTIRRILDARGATNTKIWVTEIGYGTPPNNTNAVSESKQADYVHQVFALFRGAWQPLVSGVQWYECQDAAATSAFRDRFGLVRADGSAKPAWAAFVSEVQRGL